MHEFWFDAAIQKHPATMAPEWAIISSVNHTSSFHELDVAVIGEMAYEVVGELRPFLDGEQVMLAGVFVEDASSENIGAALARIAGLRTMAAVVERELVFIGSLNLDPRSINLNTGMGLVISSFGLASEVAEIAERDMEPANSWQVRIDEDADLSWETSQRVVTRQAARNAWQRYDYWFSPPILRYARVVPRIHEHFDIACRYLGSCAIAPRP